MIKRLAITMALLSAPLAAQPTVQPGDRVRFHPGPRGVHEVVEARPGSCWSAAKAGIPWWCR
ncbi:MAG TPA: hypothetical protein VF665_09765 [Longimicrobium sp.]|jgi:hypothetical protein|uniref:hypothetical protein n=1 Tax=Longimicrobium sp. TaxID=2029185 RepID=UPI002EDB72A5